MRELQLGSHEQATGSCTYSSGSGCVGTGASYSCAQSVNWNFGSNCTGYEQRVCCSKSIHNGTQNAATRLCGMGSGNPCGAEGGQGCAVCWAEYYSTSCTASTVGTLNTMCGTVDDIDQDYY